MGGASPTLASGAANLVCFEGEGAELGTFTADDARSLVGCALSIAKGNETIQDVLVRDGARAKVRALLLKYPTVSFDGEFTPLRDWIRGDRTNSRSAEPKTPREKGAAGAGREGWHLGWKECAAAEEQRVDLSAGNAPVRPIVQHARAAEGRGRVAGRRPCAVGTAAAAAAAAAGWRRVRRAE